MFNILCCFNVRDSDVRDGLSVPVNNEPETTVL